MSRPEELPRSASPLKRRAGSVPLEDNPDATEDVDMLSLPPSAANEDASGLDGDVIQGAETAAQEENADSPRDDTSTTAQIDDVDEDIPNLRNLEMDRSSVEETQVGSDFEDNALAAEGRAEEAAQELDAELGKEEDQDFGAGASKATTQNGSSTTNTDEAADSDSKTVDTVATGTSVDGTTKSCKHVFLLDNLVLDFLT